MQKRRVVNSVFWLLCLNLVLGAFQNCSPIHAPMGSYEQSSITNENVSIEDLSQKFSTTLHPILKTNCGTCHGDFQSPKFAVDDPLEATTTILNYKLANLENPDSSYFATKIRSGHNGFTEELAQEVLAGVRGWAKALEPGNTPEPEPESGPGTSQDIVAPTITITYPTQSTAVSGTVDIQANAQDNRGVKSIQFFIDGVAFGLADTTSPYSLSWNTKNFADGAHILYATVTDTSNNVTSSGVIHVLVSNVVDSSAPSVQITSPSNGANATGSITFSAAASDDVGVAGIQFYIDGIAIGDEDVSSPFSISFNTASLTNGSHVITARARDLSGKTSMSQGRNINVTNLSPDTTKPSVSVTAPTNNSQVSGMVTLTASASDNVAISGVQFYVGGAAVGSEDTSSPYSLSWDSTSVSNGTVAITARARDSAGNTQMSSAANVQVNNVMLNPNATYTWIYANILQPRCTACHGASKAESGIRYNTYSNTLQTVRAGDPSRSPLFRETSNGNMPEGSGKLSATQLQAISDWIAAGALDN